jgi:hypothetical protein
LDAGVETRLPNLGLELGFCLECGGRLIEHGWLLVCEERGLVAGLVYELPQPEFEHAGGYAVNSATREPPGFVERASKALAEELRVPAKAVFEVYKRLRKRAGVGEAAALALFLSAERCDTYTFLRRRAGPHRSAASKSSTLRSCAPCWRVAPRLPQL